MSLTTIDHVAVVARRDVVERLPGHPAGERAVADHRDDVALLPGERVRPRQPVRPRQRGGRVAVLDVVVLALGPARVARQPAGLLQPLPPVDPAGEQLVHVGLVAGVPDQRVARGVEHPVQRDGQLDDAEVRPEVPAGPGDARDEESADLGGQLGDLSRVEPPEVGRTAQASQQAHGASLRTAAGAHPSGATRRRAARSADLPIDGAAAGRRGGSAGAGTPGRPEPHEVAPVALGGVQRGVGGAEHLLQRAGAARGRTRRRPRWTARRW